MALSPREVEDDFIIAQNEVRRNPEILLHELQLILDDSHAYYTPSTHMSTLIGERDLKDIVSFALLSTNLNIYMFVGGINRFTIGKRNY